MCMFCKNTTTIQSTTTHVVNYKDCIIVIKNVPCLECDQCGEKYYTDEVAEKLEMIVNMAKKLMQTNPDILLKDVAEMVGYTDAFYFSRVFKSHEGISPSQYAKLVKEKNF